MKRTTVRVRLTLLYGGLFFLAGAVLLTVMYLLVKQNLDTRLGGNAMVRIAGVVPAQSPAPGSLGVASRQVQLAGGQTVDVGDLQAAIVKQQSTARDQALDALLAQGGIALGVIGIVAAGFGWLMAERALRPVHEITAAARRVARAASADRGLHERIGLTGPRDEIKELADTFDEMLERLDRSFDGQRRFVANASHELRTPLAINRALAEVTLTRPGVGPDAQQLAESVLQVNARNERLIDGLLTLAASENELADRVPVDLRVVAEHVLAGTPTGEISCDSRELLGAPVLGDPVLLERLTQNLVDNAVRHNRPGGWMSVATRVEPGWAVLTVTNSGRPVAPYELDMVFEPFRRLGGDRVRSDRGLGL
ncbi:MAG TPA: HAMP domain-containing sensor histidine kinase, partial [Rugosimonospora sp.]|nr:HAMP domain-containing sensor histidine kinase [Rugosimonospora sp.]